MSFLTSLLPVALVMAIAASPAAAQTAVVLDGDRITISGCVLPANTQAVPPPDTLAWGRSGLLMAAAAAALNPTPAPIGTSGAAGRVFYWLDEDLTKYVGHIVEVQGELEDFETGALEIEREGDFTEIDLDLGDVEETARVPASWLRDVDPDRDIDLEIVARKIDVNEVRATGVCGRF